MRAREIAAEPVGSPNTITLFKSPLPSLTVHKKTNPWLTTSIREYFFRESRKNKEERGAQSGKRASNPLGIDSTISLLLVREPVERICYDILFHNGDSIDDGKHLDAVTKRETNRPTTPAR